MRRVCGKDRYGNPPDKYDRNGVEDAHDMMFASGKNPITVERELEHKLTRVAWDYQQRKADDNVKDFSDLITDMNKLPVTSTYVVGEIRRTFTSVLVEEYQYTQGRQEHMLRQRLASKPNVTKLGHQH